MHGDAVKLDDLIATGDDASDNVEIQTLDAYGRTVDSYSWNDWAQDTPCWVDGGYGKVEGITFAAGQGVFVMGSGDGQYLRFPSPEL